MNDTYDVHIYDVTSDVTVLKSLPLSIQKKSHSVYKITFISWIETEINEISYILSLIKYLSYNRNRCCCYGYLLSTVYGSGHLGVDPATKVVREDWGLLKDHYAL